MVKTIVGKPSLLVLSICNHLKILMSFEKLKQKKKRTHLLYKHAAE